MSKQHPAEPYTPIKTKKNVKVFLEPMLDVETNTPKDEHHMSMVFVITDSSLMTCTRCFVMESMLEAQRACEWCKVVGLPGIIKDQWVAVYKEDAKTPPCSAALLQKAIKSGSLLEMLTWLCTAHVHLSVMNKASISSILVQRVFTRAITCDTVQARAESLTWETQNQVFSFTDYAPVVDALTRAGIPHAHRKSIEIVL